MSLKQTIASVIIMYAKRFGHWNNFIMQKKKGIQEVAI